MNEFWRQFMLWTLMFLLCAGALVLAACGYREMKAKRFLALGDEAARSEDWRMARIWYGMVLGRDPTHVEALRRLGEGSYLRGDPDAGEWVQRWVSAAPGDPQALLFHAARAFSLGDTEPFKVLMERKETAVLSRPLYHELWVQFELLQGKVDTAEVIARDAVELFPGEVALRLRLLEILLAQGASPAHPELFGMVELFGNDPEYMAGWQRLLVAHYVRTGNHEAALEAMERRVVDFEPGTEELLGYIAYLVNYRPEKVAGGLGHIRSDPSAALVEGVARLLVSKGMPGVGLRWIDGFDEGFKASLSCRVARAELHAAAGDWEGLLAVLEEGDWGVGEYLRQAMYARAYEAIGEDGLVPRVWRDAVRLSRQNVVARIHLADVVKGWNGFESEWLELAHAMLVDGIFVRRSFEDLFAHHYQHGNAHQLLRISDLATRHLREDPVLRKQSMYFAILLDANPSRALELARRALVNHPDDEGIELNLALALLRNQRIDEAKAIVNRLSNEIRSSISWMYVAALLRSIDGHDPASSSLQAGTEAVTRFLLPEELALLESFGTVSN